MQCVSWQAITKFFHLFLSVTEKGKFEVLEVAPGNRAKNDQKQQRLHSLFCDCTVINRIFSDHLPGNSFKANAKTIKYNLVHRV